MPDEKSSTVHASCVLVGRGGVLIRGPSGSGKSRLALALIEAGAAPFARLVADDRVHLFAAHGRLLAEAPAPIRGKIEVRGFGVREIEHEPLALVQLVVDLAARDGKRMPDVEAGGAEILGVKLSRLPAVSADSALPALFATLSTVTRA